MKQVRETNAGQSISAFVILNKKGQHVGTVQAHYGNSVVTVDYWCGPYAKECGSDDLYFQQGKASGYGYDKFTAAISGLVIDGHTIPNHCGKNEASERLLKRYHAASLKEGFNQKTWDAKAKKIGASFSNWEAVNKRGERLTQKYEEGTGWYYTKDSIVQTEVIKRYSSLHLYSGLDYLTALGYKVIQAI